MRPAEEGKRLVVEALKAERQAVDAGVGEIGETAGLDRIWVCLERDLDFGSRFPVADRRVDYSLDGAWTHQRRRSAAEKDRGQRGARQEPRFVGEVREQGVAP